MQRWIDGDESREPVEIKTSHVRNPQEGKTLTIGALQGTVKATGAETGGGDWPYGACGVRDSTRPSRARPGRGVNPCWCVLWSKNRAGGPAIRATVRLL